MNFHDTLPPAHIRFEHCQELVAPCKTVEHLTTAIHEGLMRTMASRDPAFGRRREMVFLFRDSGARNNEEALRRWIEEWVDHATKMGVDDDDILDFVDRRFWLELREAGWN